MEKTKRVRMEITVDIPESHDEVMLTKYLVDRFRVDRNLTPVKLYGWDVNEIHETRDRRYETRLEMTLIALSHAISRYEMSERARSWLKAERANIRKVLGHTKETR